MPGCAICTFTMPSGRRCGAVALRGRAFCYHHDRSPRRIAQDTLSVKLARYRRELDAMDLPRLLEALLEKLDLLRAAIASYPEAQLVVAVASHRLAIVLSNYFEDEPLSAQSAPRSRSSRHTHATLDEGWERLCADNAEAQTVRRVPRGRNISARHGCRLVKQR